MIEAYRFEDDGAVGGMYMISRDGDYSQNIALIDDHDLFTDIPLFIQESYDHHYAPIILGPRNVNKIVYIDD